MWLNKTVSKRNETKRNETKRIMQAIVNIYLLYKVWEDQQLVQPRRSPWKINSWCSLGGILGWSTHGEFLANEVLKQARRSRQERRRDSKWATSGHSGSWEQTAWFVNVNIAHQLASASQPITGHHSGTQTNHSKVYVQPFADEKKLFY